MSVVLQIPVDDPDAILSDGAYGAGAIVRVQTSSSAAGPFADLSGTGADPTLPVVSGTRLYQAEDPAGSSSSWYRTRYENVGGTVLSEWSAIFQPGGLVCSVAQVKARVGADDTIDDAVILEVIVDVTSELENFTGRRLTPENGATYIVDTALGHAIDLPRGIRAVTSLEVAATDQPDDGTGTYESVPLSDVLIRPSPVDRAPGWPGTELRLLSSPIDTRLPLRTAANGARIVGDWGFNPTLGVVHRIGLNAAVGEYLDRRQAGRAGADGIDLPGLLAPAELAALGRLRAGRGMGIG